MADGILVIDKAPGWTSHDVVAKLRGVFQQKRIGHGGTLDPMATGVLTVFLGRATRAVEFAAEADKEYLTTLRLGMVTDTQDWTGNVLRECPVEVSVRELEQVLQQFRGEIFQVPPMYSALKREGKKLYQLARAGQEVEREPRPVTIYELELLEQISPAEYRLRVVCSKGTYIRTLCHDIGQKLSCGGVMAALRRTRAAGFDLSQAFTLEQVCAHPDPDSLLIPVDAMFGRYPALTLAGSALIQASHGASPLVEGDPGTYRVYDPEGRFLMLGSLEGGRLSAVKRFF